MRVLRFIFTLAAIALIAPGIVGANDDEIAQKIVTRLQEEKQTGGLKGFTIDLEVEQGTVWLSGRVASKDQQTKALDIARRIPGVKQVVNDLTIADGKPADGQSMLTGIGGAMQSAIFSSGGTSATKEIKPAQAEFPVAAPSLGGQIGSGINSAPETLTRVPQQVARNLPQNYNPGYQAAMQQIPQQQAQRPQPVAMSYATSVSHQGGAYANQPVPIYGPGSGVGAVPARYDHPNMPNYAWPSYASSPNYAAVTYPKQYSPTAWPYIGPFYPYPQVPLGWRKVTLEWDDGWWMLDFKDHKHR